MFVFSKKAIKICELFAVDLTLTKAISYKKGIKNGAARKFLHNVKSTVKILSNFVAFLENMNFIKHVAKSK